MIAAAIAAPGTTHAASQTFNSALPIADGSLVFREFLYRKARDDSSAADRDLEFFGGVSVIGYGISSELTLFGALPYGP